MNNIISELKQSVPPQLLSGLATRVGESEAGVAKALGGIFPALLGGILNKTSDPAAPGTLDQLMGLLKTTPSVDSLTSQPQALLNPTDEHSGLGGIAGQFVSTFLGDKTTAVTALIAKISGLKNTSASSLLQLAAPLVLGTLGKKVSEGNLSADGLASYLATQKSNIMAAAPVGLSGALGLADGLDQGQGHIEPLTPIDPPQKSSSLKSILMAAALALIALFAWKSCSSTTDTSKQAAPTSSAAAPAATTTPPAAVDNPAPTEAEQQLAKLGNLAKVTLPNGTVLNLPELGVENKLLAFINDSSKAVDTTSWFSFDRLLFDTGGATLQASSQEQLNNIAQMMKAYPNVKVKLGGYTDNVGAPELNLNLSQNRADAVRAQLMNLGVPAERLEAKGYGPEHPVASNDTAEGRRQNRRIDILVTAK